jgi:hypothetical protein
VTLDSEAAGNTALALANRELANSLHDLNYYDPAIGELYYYGLSEQRLLFGERIPPPLPFANCRVNNTLKLTIFLQQQVASFVLREVAQMLWYGLPSAGAEQ